MLGGNKLWALVLSLCFVFMMPSPAFAADPQITKEDLKGIKPENHKYLRSSAVRQLAPASGPCWEAETTLPKA